MGAQVTRPAPYEAVTRNRMWGVFPLLAQPDGSDAPIAMFVDPDAAWRYASHTPNACTVLAVDDVTGWAWNDIDPPEVTT